MNSERTILVTGFGPFGKHEVNASWEAVKELYELKDQLRERHNVNLIIEQIPVDYDQVANKVPLLWKEHEPQIVVHVGVSHKANCLTIEHHAHGHGYDRPDINRKYPTKIHAKLTPSRIETGIDVEQLCRRVNEKNITNECTACVSHDAGRYLCEYIFYQSLCIKPDRALFIHVPDFDIYKSQTTAKGLYDVIEFLVENL